MKMRGITGKWNAMWHSSPPVAGSPKYSTTSAGHWFASHSMHAVGVVAVDLLAHPLQELVRLRQVLAVRAVAHVEVRDGVEAEAVDAEIEPEAQRVDDRLLHVGGVEVQVGLVAEEAVPEVLLAHRVEGPVGRLGVDEDDPRIGIARVVVVPHVEVAVRTVRVACGSPGTTGAGRTCGSSRSR